MKHIIIFSIILLSFSTQAQHTSQLDSLYNGGAKSFETNVIAKIKTPIKSVQLGHYGVVILEIKVDKNGEAQLKQLTYIDEEIHEAVKSIYPLARLGWLKKGNEYKVHQPIIFSPDSDYISIMGKSIQGYESHFNDSFIAPYIQNAAVTTTIERKSLGYQSSSSSASRGAVSTSRSPQTTASTSVSSSAPKLANIQKLDKKINDQLKKNKTKKAFKLINEYLCYNPFDKDLLSKRMNIAKELGDNTYQLFDEAWLIVLDKTTVD